MSWFPEQGWISTAGLVSIAAVTSTVLYWRWLRSTAPCAAEIEDVSRVQPPSSTDTAGELPPPTRASVPVQQAAVPAEDTEALKQKLQAAFDAETERQRARLQEKLEERQQQRALHLGVTQCPSTITVQLGDPVAELVYVKATDSSPRSTTTESKDSAATSSKASSARRVEYVLRRRSQGESGTNSEEENGDAPKKETTWNPAKMLALDIVGYTKKQYNVKKQTRGRDVEPQTLLVLTFEPTNPPTSSSTSPFTSIVKSTITVTAPIEREGTVFYVCTPSVEITLQLQQQLQQASSSSTTTTSTTSTT